MKCKTLEKILACRSSALDEDQNNESNAGKYLSILNVSDDNLKESVDKYFLSSFGKKSPKDEILIQPMIQDVLASGVAFSHDQNTGQSMSSISVSFSKSTEVVTSGKKGYETWKCQLKADIKTNNKYIDKIRSLVEEIYDIFQNPIDIEFCIDKYEKLYLLQVRPLLCSVEPEDYEVGIKRCQNLEKKFAIVYLKEILLMEKKIYWALCLIGIQLI